jgi:hypothetical protein
MCPHVTGEHGMPIPVSQRLTRDHLTTVVDRRALETVRSLLTPSHRPYSHGDAHKADETRKAAES